MGEQGVIVTWRIQGFRFINGIAYTRNVGDQDIMMPDEARKYVANNMVVEFHGVVPTVVLPPDMKVEEI